MSVASSYQSQIKEDILPFNLFSLSECTKIIDLYSLVLVILLELSIQFSLI